MPFDGLRVLSLESRRAADIETLILRQGGVPFVAPSVQERSLDSHASAFRFVEQLEAGEFDMVICMTGVGIAFLRDVVTTRMPVERLASALRKATVLSRGPKPVGVLRAMGVAVDVMVPEPNTWKEIVAEVARRPERRIAVQEYGRRNPEMDAALAALGAHVTPVETYRWDLPEDLGPLKEATRRLAAGECDVILFTSSVQLDHLFEIARRLGVEEAVRDALVHRVVVASIGPVMTGHLTANGVPPDVIPTHPKMWSLVRAAGDSAAKILAGKRLAGRSAS